MTPKQEKLIGILIENYENPKNTKTLGEMILEAGYSHASSINPRLIIESETIQEEISSVVDRIKERRDAAIKRLTDKKLDKASALQTATVIDILTKNAQLLGGKETERTGIKIELTKYGDDKV